MATSPSISYSIDGRAKLHDNVSYESGLINWWVEGQSPADFEETKTNYYADTSGWYSRYYWGADAAGTESFNGTSNTITVSGKVTVYTKSIVTSSSGTFVTMYSTESAAKTACDNVPGSSHYIYTYSYGPSPINGAEGYCVYKYDLSISTTSSVVTVTKTIDVSSYIDRTYTTPYVTGISLSGGSEGDSVGTARMPAGGYEDYYDYSISTYNPGSVSYSPSRTVSSSSNAITIASHTEKSTSGFITITSGSSPSTATLTVSSGGYSDSITITTYGVWTYGSDTDSVYCSFSNVKVGDTLSVTAGSKTNTVTASSTSQNVWVTGLSSGTGYSVTASVNGATVWSGTITTSIPSNIRKLYVGVNNKAEKARKIYIGVNNKAEKVKKIYIGKDGKAKLIYTDIY